MANIRTSFITGLKFYSAQLKQLNNMTFLFDPAWNPENDNKATLPVSLFAVKSQQEVMTSEVSQKQMLFYNSNFESDDSTTDAGLLNVITDNILIKPKAYRLEIILPFDTISIFNQGLMTSSATKSAVTSALINNGLGAMGTFASQTGLTETITLSNFRSVETAILKPLMSIINFFGMTNYSSDDFKAHFQNLMTQPDYNKNSLEVMWKMRRILKMKVWNSWEYKYVSIVDLSINKEATEDGVYQASLTVQEMPVMNIVDSKISVKKKHKYSNALLKARGNAIISSLNKFEIKGFGNYSEVKDDSKS